MFTKQHYDKIVEVLNEIVPYSRRSNDIERARCRLYDNVVKAFANMLQADDPNFNSEMFFAAIEEHTGKLAEIDDMLYEISCDEDEDETDS